MKPNLVVWKHLTLKGSPWSLILSPNGRAPWRQAVGERIQTHAPVCVCVCAESRADIYCCKCVIHPWRGSIFKISNYPEKLQVRPSLRCPLRPDLIPPDTLQDVSLQHLKEGSRSSAWMGHMEVVWGQEGVKAGARHCWMPGMNLGNGGHLYAHSEPSDVRRGFIRDLGSQLLTVCLMRCYIALTHTITFLLHLADVEDKGIYDRLRESLWVKKRRGGKRKKGGKIWVCFF